MADNQQSGLLALPAELRDHIWELAAVLPESANRKNHHDRPEQAIAARASTSLPALLRVCRQIRKEALPNFFKTHTPELLGPPGMFWNLNNYDDYAVSDIRRLKMTTVLEEWNEQFNFQEELEISLTVDLDKLSGDEMVSVECHDRDDFPSSISMTPDEVCHEITADMRAGLTSLLSREGMQPHEKTRLTIEDWHQVWLQFSAAVSEWQSQEWPDAQSAFYEGPEIDFANAMQHLGSGMAEMELL